MKFLRNLMLILIFFAVLLMGGLAIFLTSPSSLKITQRFLTSFLQGQGETLYIANLQGSLSDFSADKIIFQTPSMNVDIQKLHLRILLLPLLLGEVKIQTFDANVLDIKLEHEMSDQSSPPPPQKATSLWLPRFFIQNFRLPSINVTFPNGRQLKSSIAIEKVKNITQIDQISLTYLPLKLKLKNPVQIQNTPSGLNWKNLCLIDSTHNEACFDGNWKDNLNFSLSTHLNLIHLSLLDDIFSEMMDTSGEITGSLSIFMEKGNPRYSGEIFLKEGSTYISITGMHPEHLNATLTPEGNKLKLKGTGISGEGGFTLSGLLFNPNQEAQLSPDTPDDPGPKILTLSLDGKNINVLNMAAGTVDASPHLTYVLDGVVQSVAGKIFITQAQINGDNLRAKASSSADVVFISPSGKIEKEKSHLFRSNISVTLGDDSHFDGFGIHAKLMGDLLIHSNPGEPILGTGEWKITEGTYEAYGKKFSLKGGSLIFYHSPLSNPSLNIKALYDMPQSSLATGSASAIQLGVTVTGTVASPKFGFFSTPPMSQTDILSYIVLGTPLSKASANQQAQLSQAALSYALGSGSFSLLADLKKNLGIDTMSVGTLNSVAAENLSPQNNITGANNTAVFIGKQINPRLYVSYGLGLFNQQQELKTQYALSSHWSFLTNSATSGNGADLVYTIDHN